MIYGCLNIEDPWNSNITDVAFMILNCIGFTVKSIARFEIPYIQTFLRAVMMPKKYLATQTRPQAFSRVLRKSSVRPAVRLLPFTSVAPIITSSLYLAYRLRCLRTVEATVTMRMTLLIETLAAGIL